MGRQERRRDHPGVFRRRQVGPHVRRSAGIHRIDGPVGETADGLHVHPLPGREPVGPVPGHRPVGAVQRRVQKARQAGYLHDDRQAYLQSLVENIARTKPDSMDFAREIKRLADEGWTFEQLARITCKTEQYIREYIRLVEQGEERLIRGVEEA